MTPLKLYLKQLEKLYAGQKQYADFYRWQQNRCRRLKIVSYKSNPELKETIEKIYGDFSKVKQNQCFHNAVTCCLNDPEFQYIEGYISVHGLPLEHAWNRWRGIDIDLTQEILGQRKCPHYEIFSLQRSTLMFWASRTEHSGPYMKEHYQYYVEQNNNEKLSNDAETK